ncbi:MAG: radical SAM protein [Candidatus Marsarchaeota archaeon]|nr:radical SAM protein [Candidatus Marsarchaeota archaeon]
MSTTKLAGLALTAIRSNFGQLKKPYKLTFSITFKCQSRCKTCDIWQLKPTGELSLDEIREFARNNRDFRWFEITGGEPFLRQDIVEIVKAFHENNKGMYLLTIPTNSLCNQDMIIGKIEQILQLGIPKVVMTISLDGYREMHDTLRGIPGNFDRAIGMYKRLMELKKSHPNLFFFFGYTISKYNQGQFEKCFDGVKKEIPAITYNDFHVNVGQISEYYNNTKEDFVADRGIIAQELIELMEKREKQFSFTLGVEAKIESSFLKNLIRYINTGKMPMKSRSLDASLFMDSYGNIYPSVMWQRRMGNIRDTGFKLDQIWNSDGANDVRKLIKEGKEPDNWTACEAYQTIVGDMKSMLW